MKNEDLFFYTILALFLGLWTFDSVFNWGVFENPAVPAHYDGGRYK